MTVATVPKGMSLVQAKPGTTGAVTTVQGSPKGLPQGATIVKLVGQGQTGAKGTATLLQAGQQVPAGTLVTVGGKQQMVATQNVGGKQTIVITRPGGQGTAIKQQGIILTLVRKYFINIYYYCSRTTSHCCIYSWWCSNCPRPRHSASRRTNWNANGQCPTNCWASDYWTRRRQNDCCISRCC